MSKAPRYALFTRKEGQPLLNREIRTMVVDSGVNRTVSAGEDGWHRNHHLAGSDDPKGASQELIGMREVLE